MEREWREREKQIDRLTERKKQRERKREKERLEGISKTEAVGRKSG